MTDKEMPLATTSGTPEKPAPTTVPVSAVDSTSEFEQLLEALGCRDDEIHSLWWYFGTDSSKSYTAFGTPAELVAKAAQMPENANVFYGVNPVRAGITKGRGKSDDVVGLRALYLDIDVKPGACPDWPTARTIIECVSAKLGQNPVAVVWSGHGVHGYWGIEDGDFTEHFTNADARILSKRFADLGSTTAAEHGVTLDRIYDLARVLRVPGTLNNKVVDDAQ